MFIESAVIGVSSGVGTIVGGLLALLHRQAHERAAPVSRVRGRHE